MSREDVLNWSQGYDDGFEEGALSRQKDVDEAWCQGFIEAWNMQVEFRPEPYEE